MQMIWRILAFGFLLSACQTQAKPKGFAVSHTLVNYQSGFIILVDGAHTDRGERLPFNVILIPSSNPKTGATSGGLGREPGLPEWVEVRWREKDPARMISDKEWFALDQAARDARVKEQAALPVKSARLAVRSLVPASVIEELEQSPPDPTAAYLPLKSLRLYFVWTKDGVKVGWTVFKHCCTVLHEGGDSLR